MSLPYRRDRSRVSASQRIPKAYAFAMFNIVILTLLMVLTAMELIFVGKIRVKAIARFCGNFCRGMRRVFCCEEI